MPNPNWLGNVISIEGNPPTNQKQKPNKKMNTKFTKSDAEAYINTTDKAVFIVDLLDLFSIDQLTPEIEDETEAQLLALLGTKTETFSKKTRNAISNYGKEFCIWAAQENKAGNGANTISWSFPRESGLQGRTRSADAAIDAGREILNS